MYTRAKNSNWFSHHMLNMLAARV